MVSNVQNIQNITVLAPLANEVRNSIVNDLLPLSQSDKEKIKNGEVHTIQIGEKCQVEEVTKSSFETEQVLKLTPEYFKVILALIKKSNANFEITDTGKFVTDDNKENSIQSSLDNVTDILRRIYGRRTGISSWILLWYLRKIGFDKKDDFEQIEKVLTNPIFVKKFAHYYSAIEKDDEQLAEKIFNQNPKEQKIADLCVSIINVCNALSRPLVDFIPIAFCIQNLVVPLLARWIFKEGPIHKLFSMIRGINPFLDELGAGIMGIVKPEIVDIQDGLSGIIPLPKTTKDGISSIELTDLSNKDQYDLRKVVNKVNKASERLLGRKSTLSSLIFNGILKLIKFEDYQHFASETIQKPKFIPSFYDYLGCNPESQPKKQFENPTESYVALGIKYLVTAVKSMNDFVLEKLPKYFGGFYSFQYLLMPMISGLIGDKGFLGKVLGFLRDFNPILNDLFFDQLATFREEALGVKRILQQNKKICDLFPEVPEKVANACSRITDFIRVVKEYTKAKWLKGKPC